MGCIFAKQPVPAEAPSAGCYNSASSPPPKESFSASYLSSGRKTNVSVTKIEKSTADEVTNGVEEVKEVIKVKSKHNGNSHGSAGGETHGTRERKREKPNPRLSNPPKHIHGEQVAAGWPAWLSAVAGEAIKGWTPRRADTFEKLDKASTIFFDQVQRSYPLLDARADFVIIRSQGKLLYLIHRIPLISSMFMHRVHEE